MSQVLNQNTRRRLNPFAFPAETDALFRFLMVAALMVAVNVGFLLYKSFQASVTPEAELQNPAAQAEAVEKDSNQHLSTLLVSFFFTSGVFAFAYYLYRAHPRRLIKKIALEPLTAEKDAAFLQEIETLSKSVGVESSAQVVIKKGLKSQDAQAFGTGGQFFLKFDEGWRLLRKKNPPAFRAVALHELAHIFNRDVTRSYFAKSLWTAVFWLTLIPFILVMSAFLLRSIYLQATKPDAADFSAWLVEKSIFIGMLSVQLPAILMFFALVRANLLRVREFYADCRAVEWGAREALVDILEREADKEKSSKTSRLTRFWRNHPTAFERLKVVQEPHRLFRLTPDLPLTTGILMSFLLPGIILVVIPLLMLMLSPVSHFDAEQAQNNKEMQEILITFLSLLMFLIFLIVVGCGFFLSYLVVRTLVLQLLREAVDLLVRWGKESFAFGRCLQTAFIIGVGYEVGFLIMPFAIFAPRTLGGVAWILAWFPVTVGLLWLVLLYARFFGVQMIKSHLGKAVPRWKLNLLLLSVNALLVLPFLLQMLVRFTVNQYDASTEQLMNRLLIFLSGGSILLIFGAFAASWLILKIWQTFRQPQCASCKAPTARTQFPGDFCGNCGNPLAEWLFAKA